MLVTPLILAWSAVPLAAPPDPPVRDLLAIRAAHVELGTGEQLENAVILVEGGQIVTVGEDLPIDRGIPGLELSDDQWVMPGLVNAYSRVGMGGSGELRDIAQGERFPRNPHGDRRGRGRQDRLARGTVPAERTGRLRRTAGCDQCGDSDR